MIIATTERLLIRQFDTQDAPFILELLNEPAWLRFIGDKNVRSMDDALTYLHNTPFKSYRENGYGLWMVELKDSHTPVGMCGLIKREALPSEDIGFAFLAAYNGKGYAHEAAAAVMQYATDVLQMSRLLAIANEDNARSIKLLEKLGFTYQRLINLPGDRKPVVLMEAKL